MTLEVRRKIIALIVHPGFERCIYLYLEGTFKKIIILKKKHYLDEFKKKSVLGRNRPNITKYALKRPTLPLKKPKIQTKILIHIV